MKFLLVYLTALAGTVGAADQVVSTPEWSQEVYLEYQPENHDGAHPPRIMVGLTRKTDSAAAAGNFEVKVVNAAGKEIARKRGEGEKPEKEDDALWRTFFAVNLPGPFREKLKVQVSERGNPKPMNFELALKTAAEIEAGESGNVDPFAREAFEKKGKKSPREYRKGSEKRFECGGVVIEVLAGGALLMPGDSVPWVLKGYPEAEKLKPGAFALCTALESKERLPYKGKQLWVYTFKEYTDAQ